MKAGFVISFAEKSKHSGNDKELRNSQANLQNL